MNHSVLPWTSPPQQLDDELASVTLGNPTCAHSKGQTPPAPILPPLAEETISVFFFNYVLCIQVTEQQRALLQLQDSLQSAADVHAQHLDQPAEITFKGLPVLLGATGYGSWGASLMNLMRPLRSGGLGKTELDLSHHLCRGHGSLLLKVRLLARNRFPIRHIPSQ